MRGFGSKASSLVCRLESLRIPLKARILRDGNGIEEGGTRREVGPWIRILVPRQRNRVCRPRPARSPARIATPERGTPVQLAFFSFSCKACHSMEPGLVLRRPDARRMMRIRFPDPPRSSLMLRSNSLVGRNKFPVPRGRELPRKGLILLLFWRFPSAPEPLNRHKFPVNSLLTGNSERETSSLTTLPSSEESANFQFLKCDPPAPVGDQAG